MANKKGRTDEQLLTDFVGGDQAAFTELHDRYASILHSYLSTRYFGGDEMLAEDAAQQAFLKLAQSAADLDLDEPVRPWLFSVASMCAIDIQRWRGRRPAVSFSTVQMGFNCPGFEGGRNSDLDPIDESAESSPDIVAADETNGQLMRLVQGLADEDREAIEAVYVNGLKFREAAEQLGIAEGSLKTRVHRSLRALRWRLDQAA